ncbi:phosphoglycolate phosphatase [Clostridium sp. chh4-2]|uniref:HAD family hydrolase n=1 Tax=Clostridium sp. chh4-2 TaxID=2067550 RepID=UPI000CCE0FE3|nr:HAD family hydrolase [Clostridium sp. chh4-2]PNV60636.1 phosphoglycolate phosphatase [Clostridium sp. chh4-2]
MDKKYLLFDLDGTLTDPKEGITKSVQYALKAYGIIEEDLDKLCPFIGPPLKDSYMEFYGFNEKDAQDGVYKYREYFSVKGWMENKEYPGIDRMLDALKKSGKHLMVATSKPELFAVKILKHFGMDHYFDFIGGADMEETRVRKADVIGYVLEKNGIEHLEDVIMIGDRKHDVQGAKEAGVECIGVLYGYGDRAELESAGADYIAETVEELSAMLL